MFAHEKLFDFVVSHVIGEGGDGDFTIQCRLTDFEKLCDEFVEWHKTSEIKNWVIEKNDDYLACHDNQESISIHRKGWGEDYGWTFKVIL